MTLKALLLDDLPPLPPHAKLATFDAVSMYTNIDTDHAMTVFADFLRHHPLCKNIPADLVLDLLDLIMRRNIFKFSDRYFHQQRGTAMGAPPAVVYATIYFAIKEWTMPLKF